MSRGRTAKEIIPEHFKPYLTRDVVQKFLDIFGNKKGQIKKKDNPSYLRRGWGTIEELTDVLRGAGWLTNQKETGKGVQRTKHGSSTISFRIPLKQATIAGSGSGTADTHGTLVIQFHNDHMHHRGALIREITRHFIIRALEAGGLSESILEEFYAQNYPRSWWDGGAIGVWLKSGPVTYRVGNTSRGVLYFPAR